MSKAPAYQFYPADYIQDTRTLSLAAKGAWQDLLCFMWRSEEKGKLSYNVEGYSRLFGASIEETKRVINELVSLKICDSVTECNGNVTLINRRMLRDESARKQTNKRVKRFRNATEKRPCNENVTAPSSSSSSSSIKKEENKEEKNIPILEEIIEDKKPKNIKTIRKKYCDVVLLSDIEHSKLKEILGEQILEAGIKQLDYSISVKGEKYKDHYKTLLHWNREGWIKIKSVINGKQEGPPESYEGKKYIVYGGHKTIERIVIGLKPHTVANILGLPEHECIWGNGTPLESKGIDASKYKIYRPTDDMFDQIYQDKLTKEQEART